MVAMTNNTDASTFSLADLIRQARGANLTRNELKIARARLRRNGVTNLTKEVRGPYTINPTADVATDARAQDGTLVASIIALHADKTARVA